MVSLCSWEIANPFIGHSFLRFAQAYLKQLSSDNHSAVECRHIFGCDETPPISEPSSDRECKGSNYRTIYRLKDLLKDCSSNPAIVESSNRATERSSDRTSSAPPSEWPSEWPIKQQSSKGLNDQAVQRSSDGSNKQSSDEAIKWSNDQTIDNEMIEQQMGRAIDLSNRRIIERSFLHGSISGVFLFPM